MPKPRPAGESDPERQIATVLRESQIAKLDQRAERNRRDRTGEMRVILEAALAEEGEA